jgi:hypothetical protein
MEAALLRAVFGEINIDIKDENLYIAHFSLYHALYNLKLSNGNDGYYFHLDPMRIRMIQISSRGKCSYYHADRGIFCGDFSGDENFCLNHKPRDEKINRCVSFDILKDFYENPENINFGMAGILKKLSNGIILYSLRKGEVDQAKIFFGVEYPDKKLVVKKYRELALKFHPDRNGGNEEKMRELNSHYQILREVFIL